MSNDFGTEQFPPALARISDYPSYYAVKRPSAPALSGSGGEYAYAAFSEVIDATARVLMARGVNKGDIVATMSPPRAEFFILFLAAVRIGAIWLGLNPRATQRELAHILGDAQPALVMSIAAFDGRNFADEFAALGVGGDDLVLFGADEADGFGAFMQGGCEITPAAFHARVDAVAETDPALIVYTSGTTGAPKGALLSHGGMVRSFLAQYKIAGVRHVRILNNLPINHIGCVGDVSSFALIGGGLIHFTEQFDPAGSLKAIEKNKLTVWGQVPVQLQQSIDSEAFGVCDVSSLELIFWSGGVASIPLLEKLDGLGTRLLNAYGMTEATSNIAYSPPDADLKMLSETIGRAAPDCEIKIMGDAGEALESGEEGEICVRSNHLMLGYFHRDDATRESIDAEGWLRTGDVGTLSPDGLLRLTGRKKEMFKSGGYNVYPREIEQVLEEMPGVGAVAVVAAPHPLYGECGVAYVALSPGVELSETDLTAHCKDRLANYKIPKIFCIKNDLPTLAVGKIDKSALRRHAAAAFTDL